MVKYVTHIEFPGYKFEVLNEYSTSKSVNYVFCKVPSELVKDLVFAKRALKFSQLNQEYKEIVRLYYSENYFDERMYSYASELYFSIRQTDYQEVPELELVIYNLHLEIERGNR